MFYCSLKENTNEAVLTTYKDVYEIIKLIRDNKEDLIYKSSIPRLKQTKLRGIQAFKEVIKKLTDESKIRFDEAVKTKWLNCFKMIYNFNTHALNLNGCETITFEKEISFNQVKEFLGIDDFILADKEPNCYTHDEQFLQSIFDYIMAEKLKDKDIIKLINMLFNELC